MSVFPVAEIFSSVNGEGTKSGQLAVFVRFRGCNLSCSWCDTKWANASDASAVFMSAEEIADSIDRTGIFNVTLTGGEPLIHEDIRDLLLLLSGRTVLRTEIETNGSIDLSPFTDIPRVTFTMDYKLPSSGMTDKMCLSNLALLRAEDTIKFVVSDEADLSFALKMIKDNELTERCHVFLSPVFGKMDPAAIVDFMKEHTLNNVNLQLQLHNVIWAPGTEGV